MSISHMAFDLGETSRISASVDLKRLRYFVAVAEELHFGRAAERLHIAQPPLSQQIRKLEQELGVELFRRSRGKRAELTTAGRVLLDEGRRALDHVDRAALAAQRAAHGELGDLRVGFAPSTATGVLPLAVREFRRRVPGVRLELFEFRSDALAEELRSAELDIGLLRRPTNLSGLILEVIAEERLLAALPEGHRLAASTMLSAADLAREPLISGDRVGSRAWFEEIAALYHSVGVAPQVIQEVSTVQAQLGLVAAGLGVAIVPSAIRTVVPGVTMVPIEAPLVRLFVGHADAGLRPAARHFLVCAREAGRVEATALSNGRDGDL
jgi:DNA-binding transcriptional LysR family regulator